MMMCSRMLRLLPKNQQNQPLTSNLMINEAAVDLIKDEDDIVQFLTPSIKGVIDEISVSTQAAAGDVTNESGCKRALSYGDVPEATTIVNIELPYNDVVHQPTLPGSSTAVSPVTKAKTKPKEESLCLL